MTKPIELGLKKADLQKQAKTDKPGPVKDRKEAPAKAGRRSEAEIMTLAPPRARKTNARPEIIDQIGQQLGRVYNDILSQPVPDRFLDLLQTLETGAPANPKCAARSEGRSDPLVRLEAHASGGKQKDST